MYHRVPPPDKSHDNSINKEDNTNRNSQQQKPKCVSTSIWERFQTLQKRTDDVTKKSTEKRIKHLQRKVIDNVQETINLPEDQDILREHDVKFGPPVKETMVTSDRKRKLNDFNDIHESSSSASTSEDNNQHWSEIKQYLDINKHLKGIDRGKYTPNTKLDDAIDDAISKGNFETAEKLSDHLAVREFGKKISDAIDARDYTKAKKKEEESTKAKKKKTLPWGFAHKQRWETKILDGYLQLELLKIIKPKVNQAIASINTSVQQCDILVKNEVDTCVSCGQSKCRNRNKPNRNQILTGILVSLDKQTAGIVSHVGGVVGKATSEAVRYTWKAVNALAKSVNKVSKTIEKTLKPVTNTVKKVTKPVTNTVKKVTNKVKGWFGKRSTHSRRSRGIDQCYLDACRSCRRVNNERRTNDEIIKDVCRDELYNIEQKKRDILRLENQVKFLSNKKENIVTELRFHYDRQQARSGNWKFPVSEVKIFVRRREKLRPSMKINIKDISSGAKPLAPIIYEKL